MRKSVAENGFDHEPAADQSALAVQVPSLLFLPLAMKNRVLRIHSNVRKLKHAIKAAALLTPGLFETTIEHVLVGMHSAHTPLVLSHSEQTLSETQESPADSALHTLSAPQKIADVNGDLPYGVEVSLRFNDNDDGVIEPFHNRLKALAAYLKCELTEIEALSAVETEPLEKIVKISATEKDNKEREPRERGILRHNSSGLDESCFEPPLHSESKLGHTMALVTEATSRTLTPLVSKVAIQNGVDLSSALPRKIVINGLRGENTRCAIEIIVPMFTEVFTWFDLLTLLNKDLPTSDWIFDVHTVEEQAGEKFLASIDSISVTMLEKETVYLSFMSDLRQRQSWRTGPLPLASLGHDVCLHL
jgi:hypothetical protein